MTSLNAAVDASVPRTAVFSEGCKLDPHNSRLKPRSHQSARQRTQQGRVVMHAVNVYVYWWVLVLRM